VQPGVRASLFLLRSPPLALYPFVISDAVERESEEERERGGRSKRRKERRSREYGEAGRGVFVEDSF